MIALLFFFLTLFASPFKSKSRLAAENATGKRRLSTAHTRFGHSRSLALH
jgi:hypothetical protein